MKNTPLYLDIESYSEVNLFATGVYPYAAHDSTEVLMIGYAFDEEPAQVWAPDTPMSVIPPDLENWLLSESVTIWAHNAEFDRIVLDSQAGKMCGFPTLSAERWGDTMALCYYNGLPGKLKHVLHALKLENKDPRGDRLVNKFMKPRKPSKLDKSTRWGEHNAPKDWADFKEYCRQDAKVLRKLHQRLQPLPSHEEQIRLLTNRMNNRGILLNQPAVTGALKIVALLSNKLEGEIIELTGGIKTSQRDKILVWLLDHGVDMKNSWAADNVEQVLDTKIADPAARRVLEVRSILSKTSTKKLLTMQKCALSDGRVRGTVVYGGAYRTLRWAGRLLQTHNFPRGKLKPSEVQKVISILLSGVLAELKEYGGNPLENIASCLRGLIIPAPGFLFYVADYSAIEARVLAWLCHQKDGLAEFHKGLDTYKIMAAVIYGILVDNVTTDQRKVGKDTVLGCGFNMAWKTFQRQINDRGGDKIPTKLAKEAVDAYRKKNDRIKDFWPNIEKAAKNAIRNPDKVYKISYLTFEYNLMNDVLIMGLPSGRCLHYPDPKLEMRTTPWDKNKKHQVITFGEQFNTIWRRGQTYGGKLTENAVQAIARDLMANGMLEAEKEGYDRIVMTVHDELITEVRNVKDRPTIEEFSNIIARLPDWAKKGGGIPLKAEGFITDFYSKEDPKINYEPDMDQL